MREGAGERERERERGLSSQSELTIYRFVDCVVRGKPQGGEPYSPSTSFQKHRLSKIHCASHPSHPPTPPPPPHNPPHSLLPSLYSISFCPLLASASPLLLPSLFPPPLPSPDSPPPSQMSVCGCGPLRSPCKGFCHYPVHPFKLPDALSLDFTVRVFLCFLSFRGL